jgi:tetratricopeptide (TPR) repeat protein
MTDEEKSKREIISRYLNQLRKVLSQDEKIAAYKSLIDSAIKHAFDDLTLFFKGVLSFLENNHKNAIELFHQAIAVNGKLAYPWHGLGNVYLDQEDYEKAKEAFLKAIALDDNFASPWNGLGVVYREQKDYEKAKEAFLKAIALDNKYALPWNGLGKVYRRQKNYEKAKEAFLKAIALDDKYSNSWYDLGTIYCDQKDFEKAEEAFLRTIALDDKFAYPWNGLGIVYRSRKDYGKAKEAFLKAISLEDKAEYPWNGLGNVYLDQEDYEKAKEAFLKAIALDDNFASPWNGLGVVYREQKDYEKAKEAFLKAIALFKIVGDSYWGSIAENSLNQVIEKIKTEISVENVRKNSYERDPLALLLSKTEQFEGEVFNNQKAFQKFVVDSAVEQENQVYLKVLRRWNSYTPIVADNYNVGKGGGYFLKFRGKGIVIDPGFNFIDNFKGAGYCFDEIDIILISHAHNDHTSDLESILTLLNTCNKRRKGLDHFSSDDTVRADIAKSRGIDISKVTDEDIEKEFSSGSSRRKTLDLYITKSVDKKFGGMLNLYSKADYSCHIVEKGDEKTLLGGMLKVKIIYANHNDIISDRDSVGFVFDFDDTILIYTGDTGWCGEIEAQYQSIFKEYDGKHIVLLAHLGGFKEYENKYLSPDEKGKCFYINHLGRLGLGKLVSILKPQLCFISEFGEELRKHREELVEIYHSIFTQTFFLPADIGLEYHIMERKVRAITEIDLEKYTCKFGLVDPKQVKTCLLRKDYSLHYFYKKAAFKEGDLAQVLIDGFYRSFE